MSPLQASPGDLLLLACSARKLAAPAPAIDLYQGVMYQTYRRHVQTLRAPRVVILSALYGFVAPNQQLAPYDCRLTEDRAKQLLATLDARVAAFAWPSGVRRVVVAGGELYRRVILAAVPVLERRRLLTPGCDVVCLTGAIGVQRSSLGRYLDGRSTDAAIGVPSRGHRPQNHHPASDL